MTLRSRVVRSCAQALVVGVAATTVTFVVVRNDIDRLNRQRVDRPAAQALLSVQHFAAAVDQILAIADGVYATSGGDPARFTAVLAPDVAGNSTIAGMALVVKDARGARVAATVGVTPLLNGAPERARALAAGGTSTLVAHATDRNGSRLGFAMQVGHGAAVVYVEVHVVPSTGADVPFAVVSTTRPDDVVIANTTSPRGLVRSSQPVAIGGQSFALLVRAPAPPPAWFGLELPELVLLVGAVITALAMTAVSVVTRRTHAVQHLSHENRELDAALERQRAIEAELRASRARFETIVRDSPDVIALLDRDTGACEVLNRADFFGYPLQQLAEPGGLRDLVHPDDAADADAHWERMAMLEADQVCETTLRIRDTGGADRYVRLRFSPIDTGEAEERTPLLGLISDVTDEWANQLREASLQEALRRSQRLEAVGQLAGGIAHDFNNVLAAVQASVELLMDDVGDGPGREYANEIHSAAGRGAALVRQLLTFAQQDRAEPSFVDLNDVVAGMEPMLRRTLGAHIQLQVTTSEEPCTVLADRTHIEQVVLNLVVNARDAMPDGGVLWVASTVDDDRVVLSVTDTGTGIPPDVRDRIFEPFMTTKDPGKGTGLGLATVLSIVQECHAEIRVISEAGQGTTMEISFARRAESDAAPAGGGAAESVAGYGRRVLLVEDDGSVRASLARLLERRGFEVVCAPNASEALRIAEQQHFDVVCTDANMPGMSGIDLARELRTRVRSAIVLMSGYSRELVASESLPGDIVRLRKPFTSVELLGAIATACERLALTVDETLH